MQAARATMRGAISIVNAIATGKGAALGISLELTAEVALAKGKGVKFISGRNTDRLITNVVRAAIPKSMLDNNMVIVRVRSQIPIGYGLKSSSAVSNGVSLACARLVDERIDDDKVIQTAVAASLAAGVSITGAMDDATACYYGGFVLTDNGKRKLIRREPAPPDLVAVIFLPRNVPRGNVTKLSMLSSLFSKAIDFAQARDYWNAMMLNGVLASAALSNSYAPALGAITAGAYSVSVSGNGPATAAIVSSKDLDHVRHAFLKFDGRVITSNVNNAKASVELIDIG